MPFRPSQIEHGVAGERARVRFPAAPDCNDPPAFRPDYARDHADAVLPAERALTRSLRIFRISASANTPDAREFSAKARCRQERLPRSRLPKFRAD